MMRLAYVCADPGVPVFGTKGCSVHVQEVLRALVRRGDEVTLFAIRAGGDCPADLTAVRNCPIRCAGDGPPPRRERALLTANAMLRDMLLERGPFDLVYERHALWAYAAMEFARNKRIIGVLEVNAPLIDEQAAHRQLHFHRAARRASSRAFHAAQCVVAVSAPVAHYIRGFGIRENCIHVVPNGVRCERFGASRNGPKKASDVFTIGFVGSLRPWHAVADLIDAFHRLKSTEPALIARLRIVGHGPQKQSLERQVALLPENTRSAVEFTGAIPYEDIPQQLAAMDVAVAPYASNQECYFSPLKLFEYMAAGLPIVAAQTGQLNEIIRHRDNGLLFPPGDTARLTAALRELHDDAALRQRLGSNARRDAARCHTWRQRVDQIMSKAMSQPRSTYIPSPAS